MKSKVIIVSKRTSFERISEGEDDFGSSSDIDPVIFEKYRAVHNEHYRSLNYVVNEVEKLAQIAHVGNVGENISAISGDIDLVITVGGDGTLLSASHGIDKGVPVLAFNSDPKTSVGFFCAAHEGNFKELLVSALDKTCSSTALTRMRVVKNGTVITGRVLNDVLFCHKCPATTANYKLSHLKTSSEIRTKNEGGHELICEEDQKSSGFWIGPAAGSTAARRSAGAKSMKIDSKDLQLCVRELYHRPGSPSGRKEWYARISNSEAEFFAIKNKMDNAVMYIDGDYNIVPLSLGDDIRFIRSHEDLILLGKS